MRQNVSGIGDECRYYGCDQGEGGHAGGWPRRLDRTTQARSILSGEGLVPRNFATAAYLRV